MNNGTEYQNYNDNPYSAEYYSYSNYIELEHAAKQKQLADKLAFKGIRNYKLDTLTYSDTALKEKIDNKPKDNIIINNLYDLCYNLLDPLTDKWNEFCKSKNIPGGIIISSGYRCNLLNKRVGGAEDSSHKYGLAVDMVPCNYNTKLFLDFCKEFLTKTQIKYDQLINEKPYPNGAPKWIHLGYKKPDGSQRKQNFVIN